MAVAELHFFDRDDPNGATIFECSTDDSFLKGLKLNLQRDSLGGGQVSFARKVPAGGLFTRGIIVPETLVRILVPSIDTTHYLQAFFINPRQQQVISKSEQGGEGFTFAGPGPKHYLERMLLWSSSFSGFDNAVEKDSGIWSWPSTARAGAILNRLLLEEQDNPHRRYLIDLTKSFGDVNDSAGVPWADDIAGTEDFTLNIGDDYLKILWQIEDASGIVSRINLGTVSNPLLQLDAYQTFGRNLEGDPDDPDAVHFIEGQKIPGGAGNISTELEVEGSSYAKASDALVKGNDGVYHFATHPGYTPGDLRKVVLVKYQSANTATLDRAGERYLRRQDNGEHQIELGIVPGFEPESGLYMPSPTEWGNGHYWVGDTVSLTTGIDPNQTELDYDGEPQVVTGIELELTDAVRDDSPLESARSWIQTVFLNYERKGSGGSNDLAGSRNTVQVPGPPVKLCRLPIAGTDAIAIWYPSSTAASVNPTDDADWESSTVPALRTFTNPGAGNYGATAKTDSSESGTAGGRDVCLYRGAISLTTEWAAIIAAGGAKVTGQFRVRSRSGTGISESSQHRVWQIGVRVTTGVSTTIRGTAKALHTAADSTGYVEWRAKTTPQNRTIPEITLSAVAGTVAGDLLIIELGYRDFTLVTGGASMYLMNSAVSDLPVDDTTESALNSWISLFLPGSGGSDGDLPLPTVATGNASSGTSTRLVRCDHQHEHGLLSPDGTAYHDINQIQGALRNVDPDMVPEDGQVLTWDDTTELWVAETPTGGGGSTSFVSIAKWGND